MSKKSEGLIDQLCLPPNDSVTLTVVLQASRKVSLKVEASKNESLLTITVVCLEFADTRRGPRDLVEKLLDERCRSSDKCSTGIDCRI